jgi:DNA-binding XRE family transcriptional regulator
MNKNAAKRTETTLVESRLFRPFLLRELAHSFHVHETVIAMPPSNAVTVASAAYRREVGARLRLVRRALRSTAALLAAELGVTGPRWSHWENGRHLADVRIMVRLCRRYGVTLDYLYLGDESGLPRRLFDAIRQLINHPPLT